MIETSIKNIEKNSLTCSFYPDQNQKIFLIGDSSITNLADTLIKEYPKYNYQVHIAMDAFFYQIITSVIFGIIKLIVYVTKLNLIKLKIYYYEIIILFLFLTTEFNYT